MCGAGSTTGVVNVLNRLTAQGIVHRTRCDRVFIYELNHDHLIVPALHAIAGLRDSWVYKLMAEIEQWEEEPLFAAIHGQALTRDHGSHDPAQLLFVMDSDIDRELYERRVRNLCQQSAEMLGTATNATVHYSDDLNVLRQNGAALLEVLHGHELLAGSTQWLWSVARGLTPASS